MQRFTVSRIVSGSLDFREQFRLLLLRTDTAPTRQTVLYRLYKRFKEGDYLSKAEHRGLLGIK
ncbi:hypothetical protein HF329_12610 [Chitinophaga oryzae]|uniref:Uncharacterized protein n=1 Tax=Chitinophaga oryzae TaxID=2725414 RepID=A0AAE6ZGC5_9BACT|nr:hypothetical protein [Chitinophaga oryzae]QJB32121.1 hypothetical protein HF329_12610 [Chitinophaga oryzae]